MMMGECPTGYRWWRSIRGYSGFYGMAQSLTLASVAANVQDNTGMTGLHILCSLPHQDTPCTGDIIRTYLNLAPEAANVQDSKGMTPFQYLCESDVTFFDDGNFSSVMIWWYHCMPPQAQTDKKRKRGCAENQ